MSWLFLIQLPIGAVGLPLAVKVLRDTHGASTDPSTCVDWASTALGLNVF
ncbi:MAG: hypothetical protein R2716_05955 [Microthrixaceae bacterium]